MTVTSLQFALLTPSIKIIVILENKEEVEYIITTYDISAWLNVMWNTVGLLDKGHQMGNDEEFEF